MRLIFFFVIILSLTATPQVVFEEASFGFGGGSASGNSPAVTVLASNVSIMFNNESWKSFSFKGSFIYAEDFDRLLPEDRTNKYYSSMKCVNFSAAIKQELSESFFLREGIGAAYLNDRIFAGQNEWAAGISSFISLNYSFNDKTQNKEGFSLALQLDYASAFSNTNPTLTLFTVQLQKSF